MTKNSDHRCYDELFIGGQWRKPANPQQLDVISPHSEQPIGHAQRPVPRTSTPPSPPRAGPSITAHGRG